MCTEDEADQEDRERSGAKANGGREDDAWPGPLASNRSISFADLQKRRTRIGVGANESPFVGAVRKSGVDQGL